MSAASPMAKALRKLKRRFPLNAYEKKKIRHAREVLRDPRATHLQKSEAEFVLAILGVKL